MHSLGKNSFLAQTKQNSKRPSKCTKRKLSRIICEAKSLSFNKLACTLRRLISQIRIPCRRSHRDEYSYLMLTFAPQSLSGRVSCRGNTSKGYKKTFTSHPVSILQKLPSRLLLLQYALFDPLADTKMKLDDRKKNARRRLRNVPVLD